MKIFEEAVSFVLASGKATIPSLQRRFRLSYTGALELINIMEEQGIVGPQNGSKPRKILKGE